MSQSPSKLKPKSISPEKKIKWDVLKKQWKKQYTTNTALEAAETMYRKKIACYLNEDSPKDLKKMTQYATNLAKIRAAVNLIKNKPQDEIPIINKRFDNKFDMPTTYAYQKAKATFIDLYKQTIKKFEKESEKETLLSEVFLVNAKTPPECVLVKRSPEKKSVHVTSGAPILIEDEEQRSTRLAMERAEKKAAAEAEKKAEVKAEKKAEAKAEKAAAEAEKIEQKAIANANKVANEVFEVKSSPFSQLKRAQSIGNLRIAKTKPIEEIPFLDQIKLLKQSKNTNDYENVQLNTKEQTEEDIIRKIFKPETLAKMQRNLISLNEYKINRYHDLYVEYEKALQTQQGKLDPDEDESDDDEDEYEDQTKAAKEARKKERKNYGKLRRQLNEDAMSQMEKEFAAEKKAKEEKAKNEQRRDDKNALTEQLVERLSTIRKLLEKQKFNLQQDTTLSRLKRKIVACIRGKNGINSLLGDSRSNIRLEMLKTIFGLSRNYVQFTDQTVSFALQGGAGTGKTTTALVFANVYKKLGILAQGSLIQPQITDIISSAVGKTGEQMTSFLISGLENVLFIDEVYGLSNRCKLLDEKGNPINNSGEADLGMEAITVLLAYLSGKFKGLVTTIIAGYKANLECFLRQNEGLPRRFADVHDLGNYTSQDLTHIFVIGANKSLLTSKTDFKGLNENEYAFVFQLIDDFANKSLLKNQTGDIDLLIQNFTKEYSQADDEDVWESKRDVSPKNFRLLAQAFLRLANKKGQSMEIRIPKQSNKRGGGGGGRRVYNKYYY